MCRSALLLGLHIVYAVVFQALYSTRFNGGGCGAFYHQPSAALAGDLDLLCIYAGSKMVRRSWARNKQHVTQHRSSMLVLPEVPKGQDSIFSLSQYSCPFAALILTSAWLAGTASSNCRVEYRHKCLLQSSIMAQSMRVSVTSTDVKSLCQVSANRPVARAAPITQGPRHLKHIQVHTCGFTPSLQRLARQSQTVRVAAQEAPSQQSQAAKVRMPERQDYGGTCKGSRQHHRACCA